MNKKILYTLLMVIILIFVLNTTYTYASPLGDVISGGKDFLSSGTSTGVSVNQTNLKKVSNDIYNILLIVSFVVVAVIGICLGIKFMMSGVDEKADVKKSLTVFAIGTVVTYGAFGIWKVLVTFLNTL